MFKHALGGARRHTSRRALLLAVCCVSMLGVPAAASANPLDYSTGSAYDIGIKSGLINTFATVGPSVGPVTSNTTTDTKSSTASVSTDLAKANVLSAEVATENEYSNATATIANVAVTLPGAPGINGTTLYSNATATCRKATPVLAGEATGTVTIKGTRYDLASVPPNTTIPLGPLGSVVLNEQTITARRITVNAIDVKSLSGTQVVVASATAGMTGCFFG